MTNSVNSAMANKPSFSGCAVLGNKAEAYFAERLKKEGPHAIERFNEFCDKLTNWGYVNINKTPKEDVFELQSSKSFLTTKIDKNTRLDDLMAKLTFLKENKAIIDQA